MSRPTSEDQFCDINSIQARSSLQSFTARFLHARFILIIFDIAPVRIEQVFHIVCLNLSFTPLLRVADRVNHGRLSTQNIPLNSLSNA